MGDKGEVCIGIVVMRDGSGAMIFHDKNNNDRITQGLQADGTPILALQDEKGRVIWKAP